MKKVIALLMCLLMALPVFGCTSVGNNAGSDNKNKKYTLGETAETKNIKITMTGFTENTGSELLIKPDAGRIFLLFEFSIENISTEDYPISSMINFECFIDSIPVTVSLGALAGKGGKEQLDGTVAAGKTMNGVIGFEVPSGWKKGEIKFKPDILKNDKVSFLAERS